MNRKELFNMISFWIRLCLLLLRTATSFEQSLDPSYLNMLLFNKDYEKFAEVTGLTVDLVKPGPGTSDNPMFNRGLIEGDIIPNANLSAQERQNVKFDVYTSSKWPGVVPYAIQPTLLLRSGGVIQGAINEWNNRLGNCIRWIPRTTESAYVYIFNGDGCYSSVGRIGRQQLLSLQIPDCLSIGTVLHEMEHASGFTHEHNRGDRDTYVKVLTENIPPEWQNDYTKNDPDLFGITQEYDYYSVMHYPLEAPDSGGKPAFQILQPGIIETRLGQRDGFTETDIRKVRSQYCVNSTRSS